MTFEQALKVGERCESEIAQLLVDSGVMVLRDHSDARHDMVAQLGGRFHLLEVKDERKYTGSGNVVIELMQRGKPSGLSVSEASVYLHRFDEQSVVYRAQPMRLWLKATDVSRYWRQFGDNQNAGFVLPYRLFIDEPWAELITTTELESSRIWRFQA